MPIWVQWVSFAFAVVGFCSGLYALYLNHERTTIVRRQEKERLEEKKKAKFKVDTGEKMGSKRIQKRFLLTNVGQAEARNVQVEFYNYDREKNRKKCDPLAGESVPSTINSGQTVDMLLVADMLNAPPYDIVITWEDDNKSDNIINTTLNL
ncbi:hypothetical protein ACTWQB_15730 [Piscibacillus sp. B03]|uniref:hypothetical protein n=1 Tax=Piscibacillus sp. B03 TaxID=3457430 RepID=UPI003FCDC9D7